MSLRRFALLIIGMLGFAGGSQAAATAAQTCPECYATVTVTDTCSCLHSYNYNGPFNGHCDPPPLCPPDVSCTTSGTISKKCGPGWIATQFSLSAACGSFDFKTVSCTSGSITIRLDCSPCEN